MKKAFLFNLIFLTFAITALAQSDIRKIDFNNFTYAPFCGGEDAKQITVRNSEFSEEKQMDGYTERLFFKVFSVTNGDLNGDGRDEAFVLTLCNNGEASYFSEGFVFTLKNDKPVLLTRIEGGDRASGGLRSAKIEKGNLVVERYALGELENVCCPEFYIATSYKWNGKELMQTSISAPREVFPATPVSFEAGKNTAAIKVSLFSSKFQRFAVKARVGQFLSVSTSSKTVRLSLPRGAADVNQNQQGFVASLNENGEFIIQVENISGENTEAFIKIELRDNL
jgi:hypothetical protein